MKLKHYNKSPWQFFYDMDKAFENWEDWGFPLTGKKDKYPACDFYEDKDHYFISFDLPGLTKENLKIHYENNVLTVSGTRREEYKEEHKNHSHFMERFYGSFSRSFNLPSSIDEDKIEAHFTNGVLELLLPKAVKGKGKEIPVKEGKRGGNVFSGKKAV